MATRTRSTQNASLSDLQTWCNEIGLEDYFEALAESCQITSMQQLKELSSVEMNNLCDMLQLEGTKKYIFTGAVLCAKNSELKRDAIGEKKKKKKKGLIKSEQDDEKYEIQSTKTNKPNSVHVHDSVNFFDKQLNSPARQKNLNNQPRNNQPRNYQSQKITTRKHVKAIVLGVTGAGKSSLINLLYTWHRGIEKIEDIEDTLIPTKYLKGIDKTASEFASQDQSKSQTQRSNTYTFDLVHDSTVYNLQFMDTPGIGDVTGIKKDDDHIENILDTISKTPELNAIVLMINGSDPRISHRLQYVMTKIIGIIPNVCQDNLIVLLSNVTLKPNLNVQNLLDRDIPAKHIFYMNNEMFSIDVKNEEEPTLSQANFLYSQLKLKLKKFLDVASDMKMSDTSRFRELKEKRDQFRNDLILLRGDCEDLGKKRQKIKDMMVEIANKDMQKNKLDLNKFKKIKQTKTVQETTSYHNTICQACDSNCHEQCGLQETTQKGADIFKGCTAMGGGENCQVCTHHYTSHVHLRTKWVKRDEEISVLDENQQKLIEEATTSIAKQQELLQSLENSIKDCEKQIEGKKNQIGKLISQLKTICSDFNYAKEIFLTTQMLEERIECQQHKNNMDDVAATQTILDYFKGLLNFVKECI